MATQPSRETKSSIQVAVRLPKPLYERMRARGEPIARQIVLAVEAELSRRLATERRAVDPSASEDQSSRMRSQAEKANRMEAEELLEMSYPRRIAETIINGLQDPLNQHLIKLVGFEFPPQLRQHFHQECEAWLDRIQRMRLKPNNRPGSVKFYYDLLFDYPFGGVEVENMRGMMDFIARRYPEARPTQTPQQMAAWLRAFHTELAERLSDRRPVLDMIPA